MLDSDDLQIPPEQKQLNDILMKMVTYQHSLPDGRAVELEEMRREGVLSSADIEFLTSHSVTYKPHQLSDHHAVDMLHMPTKDGGCVFIGPAGPRLTKRRASLSDFQPIVESFLKLPKPRNELLLHIELTRQDGMSVAPEMICFTLQSASWKQRLPAIRSIAAELGFHPFQDEEVQGNWLLTFRLAPDIAHTAASVIALLSRGCGLSDQAEVTYSAGALDAT